MFGLNLTFRLFTYTLRACPIFGSNWCKLYCFSHQTADFRHSLSRNRSKTATAPCRWHKAGGGSPFGVDRIAPVIMILISDHVTIIINCVLTADFFCSEGTLEFYILLIANGLRKRTVTWLLIFQQWEHAIVSEPFISADLGGGSMENSGCFLFSVSPAQSMRSEPFGVARAAYF